MNISLDILKLPQFIKIIMGVNFFIISFIVYGIYHDGRKSLTYPITRFQLLVVIGLLWISIFVLLDEYNHREIHKKNNR
jgi:hypothetical protein